MRRSRAEVDRYVSSLQASAPSPKEVSEGSYVGAEAFRGAPFVPKTFKGGRFRAVQLTKALPHVRGRADAAPLAGREADGGGGVPYTASFRGLNRESSRLGLDGWALNSVGSSLICYKNLSNRKQKRGLRSSPEAAQAKFHELIL